MRKYLSILQGSVAEYSDSSYASRMSFYKAKQFQCDVTGKGGLDFFQALNSEQQEARTLHSRFPEQLKGPVLRAVQWRAHISCPAPSCPLTAPLPTQRSWVVSTSSSRQSTNASKTATLKQNVRSKCCAQATSH